MKANEGQEPDARPHVRGASRGQDDSRDAEDAGGGERTAATSEYAANAEAGAEGAGPPASES